MSHRVPPRVYIDIEPQTPAFDVPAFDEVIWGHGIEMVHWRAMVCPVGRVDIGDGRSPHADHEGCSNGFLLTKAGVVTGLFSGNPKSHRQKDEGLMSTGTARISLPREYDDHQEEVLVAPFDRLYLRDEAVKVPHWEQVRMSDTGVDKLSFPVMEVQDLVDWTGVRYTTQDFKIQDGRLVWTGKRPPPEPSTGRAIYSVRYFYRPYWIVTQLEHELRLVHDRGLGNTDKITRAPQSVMVQRENVFRNQQNDQEARGGDPARQQAAPEDGGLGPR